MQHRRIANLNGRLVRERRDSLNEADSSLLDQLVASDNDWATGDEDESENPDLDAIARYRTPERGSVPGGVDEVVRVVGHATLISAPLDAGLQDELDLTGRIAELKKSGEESKVDLQTLQRRLSEAKHAARKLLIRSWAPSSEPSCMRCQREFSLFVWRYWCRVCGHVFCRRCCSKRRHTTYQQEMERCCDDCYADTLRQQKIRQLRRKFDVGSTSSSGRAPVHNIGVTDEDDTDSEFDFACDFRLPDMCYSSNCRVGLNSRKCYSPYCRAESSGGGTHAQHFSRLVVQVKDSIIRRGGVVSVTGTELYQHVQDLRVETQHWVGYVLFVLEGRHPLPQMQKFHRLLTSAPALAVLDKRVAEITATMKTPGVYTRLDRAEITACYKACQNRFEVACRPVSPSDAANFHPAVKQ